MPLTVHHFFFFSSFSMMLDWCEEKMEVMPPLSLIDDQQCSI